MMKWLLLFLLVPVAAMAGEDLHKEFKSQPGKKLEMRLDTGGDVKIEGVDGSTVTVDVRFRGRSDEESSVEVEESSDGITVTSHYADRRGSHHSSPRFEVRVPKKYDLEIETSGGKIEISNIEGEMEGTTMGGSLELSHLKGKISFHTMGGKIALTKSEVDGEVRTNGGNVLLEDIVGNVSGHSMGGNVVYRNVTDAKGKSTGKTVKITTMGGEINVDDAPYGADVSTMGGDIEIRSAADFVKAKTMGGDIRVDKVDGGISAETMGGDIEVTMIGNPAEKDRAVEISSKGGDITLTVPRGLSMDVDIRIAYSRDSWYDRKGYRIESDFDLVREKSEDGDKDHKRESKSISAHGQVAGGKNKVRIRTIDGNVYLKSGN